MLIVLGSLVVGGALALRPAPPPADSGAGCAALARATAEAPSVAADVRATLALHGAVVRWSPADGPVRVWVQPRPVSSVNWEHPDPEWRDAVLGAAGSWRGVVPGLAYAPAADSATAHVVVTWDGGLGLAGDDAPGMSWRTAGRTLLASDGGRARRAHVRLALVAPTGEPYGVGDVRAVARHEFGHVLGLAHHAARRSVMAPLVRVERLADSDRAALRLLYALPTGARCEPPRAAAGR